MGGRETSAQRAKRDARYLEENYEKCQARWAVKYAVKTGRLRRGRCRLQSPWCAGRIEAHHHDYTRPLDVEWYCVKHHRDGADRVDAVRVRPPGVEPGT